MAEKEIQIVYTVPNQKVVKVKHDLRDKAHLYTMCNLKSNKKALQELSPNTYKLYMYFSLNQDDYTFALSCQAVCNATGMSDSTYKKAVRELIDKEYLVKSKTKGLYIFYEGTVNSSDRSVEINRQEEEKDTTENKKETIQKVKKNSSCGVKNNGEIIQDNTKNNTIYTTETASTMPIEEKESVASLEISDEKKQQIVDTIFRGGKSFKEIALMFNVSAYDVSNIRKEFLEKQEAEQKEKNKQQEVYYPDESEPAPMQGVETDFDMDIDFKSNVVPWKNDSTDLKRIIKVKVQEYLNNGYTRREVIFNELVDDLCGHTYQCQREPIKIYLNGLLDAIGITSEQAS